MDKFETGDTATRRTILMAIGSNLTLFNKKLAFEARTPFFKIQQKVKEINSINWLEPKGNTESTENKGILDSQNVIWGSLVDDCRANYEPKYSGKSIILKKLAQRYEYVYKI